MESGLEILAPVTGRLITLKEVPDEVLSQGMAGEGTTIIPSEGGEIPTPVSGKLVKLSKGGGHAFGIDADGDVELLVHLRLVTVELNGRGFEKLAVEEDRVEYRESMVRLNLPSLRVTGYTPATLIVVSNADKFHVSSARSREVAAGDIIFEVED